MNSLSLTYIFDTTAIRVVGNINTPLFVASDIAKVLGFDRPRDAFRLLDDDEKGAQIVRTPGGDQEMICVNESGLYNLIFRSRKPEAKAFRKWVTSEVLPSIRTTGGYQMHPSENIGSTPVRFIQEKIQLLENMVQVQQSFIHTLTTQKEQEKEHTLYSKTKVTAQERQKMVQLKAEGMSTMHIAHTLGRNISTVNRNLKKANA